MINYEKVMKKKKVCKHKRKAEKKKLAAVFILENITYWHYLS